MQPITYTFEELLAHKEKAPREAVEALKNKADKILAEPTLKITDVEITRPSGDPHDYISMGPYWWPNPDTPDGLPYISRDGIINPETLQEVNAPKLYPSIKQLALAAFYFGEKKYSEYAERQLYAWFVNPETRMNPNARFAQSIPGITDGSGYGLIDFAQAHCVFDAIYLLECMGEISEQTVSGVISWYNEFLDWMLTSEHGLLAGNCVANHGTWYDAHVLSAAVATDRWELIRRICTYSYHIRNKRQIDKSGGMPGELSRTAAMSYTFFNFDALLIIANIAERNGFGDYWSVDPERGVCLLKLAADFIYPYVKNPESFPYKELRPGSQGSRMAQVLRSVDKRFPGQGYAELAREIAPDDTSPSLLLPPL